MWHVRTTLVFDAWFSEMADDCQEEIIATVEMLKRLGPQLGRPHADTLKGSKHTNMKELRAKTATAVLRVAFAFDPKREAILLVAGNKSGISEKQFYKKLITKADELFDVHLATLDKNGGNNGKIF